MARFSITRTVERTEITALCFDKISAEAFNKTITIPEPIRDLKKLERKAAKVIEQDANIRFIEVVDSNITSGVYGISEEDFFAHAVPLDPKTRKALN